MSKFSQKGISLYLSIMIMVILLAIVLGISGILIGQLKMMKGMENSIVAFYAADTGIERALKDIYGGSFGDFPYEDEEIDGAYYDVEVACCLFSHDWCNLQVDECLGVGLSEDTNCLGSYYCIKSVGTYRETKRAIQTSL